MSIVVTHTTPRLRGSHFASLIGAYKSLFTLRNVFDAEYDISYKRYPAPEVFADDTSGVADTATSTTAPPKTWAERVTEFGNTWLGSGPGDPGKLRGQLGNGVGMAESAADRYAQAAIEKLDPVYAAQVRARQAAVAPATDNSGVTLNTNATTPAAA